MGIARWRTQGVCQRRAVLLTRHLDPLHPQLRKGEQLNCLTDAVLVGILPQLDAGKGGIGGVELPVVVAVQISQSLKTVGCALPGFGSSGEQGVVAKELAPRINRAVAVQVPHHDGLARTYPACGVAQAVAVMVEEDGVSGFYAAVADATAV